MLRIGIVIILPGSRIWNGYSATFLLNPVADERVRFLDRRPVHMKRVVRAIRLEVRILVPALEILLHEGLVGRPAISRRKGEVVIGVDASDDTFRVILADGVRRDAEGDRAG